MTEFINNFHFIRPYFLLLAIPAVFLTYLLLRREGKGVQWQTVIAPHLLPSLLDGKSVTQKKFPLYTLLALWLLGSIALAGPAWTKLAEPVQQKTDALVVVWDLSPSMLAQDIKPSRLVRSRLKLIDLLRKRKEGLTGLIAYSGEAHVVTPLTDDTETIISLLAGLDPNIMPAKGSNAEMALETAHQLLKDSGIVSGNILFITDGIDSSAHLEMLQLHETAQHAITLWGIGTAAGAPIPIANGGFAYDRNRDMVIASLDERELSDLASKLGGLYLPFSQNEFDIDTLESFVFNSAGTETKETDRLFDKWYEHGPYLLLFLLPIAALSFRRGWLLSVVFMALLSGPQQADAFEWRDMWQTKDQQAMELLNSDPAAAAETFKNKDWQAISNYKAGKFGEAAKGFDGARQQDLYNQANALTHLGDYDKAIESYKKSLELNPEFEDAQHNLNIAKKLKELSEQQQDSQDGEPQENSEQNNQQDSEQDSQQSESNSEQQSEQSKDSQQQESSEQQQSEQSEDQQQTDNAQTSKEQQKALDETYGKESEQETPEAESDEQKERLEEQEQTATQQTNEEEQKQAENEEQKFAEAVPITQEEMEQQEADQALEQWLRKVPDDPSGLLRNKFRYEYGQRKRELQQNHWKNPNGEPPEERW
ncbi:Ca-activated chloride channel family protein [Alteromonadaceae bacterium Bs31]|nr:Ca-activated chloride channel family protein [Alteromonadaceae bacterium Bs31]